MTERTFCSECDNMTAGKSEPPWRWQCLKFPRLEGFGHVTQTTWDNMPPYGYCKDINHGACPLFVARKTTEPNPKGT